MSTEFETEVEVSMFDDSILSGESFLQPVTIHWSIEFEMRSWGVKNIYLHVPDQKITLVYQIEDENGDYVDAEKEIQLQNVEVEAPNNPESFGHIAPHTLDFHNGKVMVQF